MHKYSIRKKITSFHSISRWLPYSPIAGYVFWLKEIIFGFHRNYFWYEAVTIEEPIHAPCLLVCSISVQFELKLMSVRHTIANKLVTVIPNQPLRLFFVHICSINFLFPFQSRSLNQTYIIPAFIPLFMPFTIFIGFNFTTIYKWLHANTERANEKSVRRMSGMIKGPSFEFRKDLACSQTRSK